MRKPYFKKSHNGWCHFHDPQMFGDHNCRKGVCVAVNVCPDLPFDDATKVGIVASVDRRFLNLYLLHHTG